MDGFKINYPEYVNQSSTKTSTKIFHMDHETQIAYMIYGIHSTLLISFHLSWGRDLN